MLTEFLTSIADKLREKLGTSDTINAQSFPSKIDEVYEKGEADGREAARSEYINPNWTDWRYFSVYNNRLALLKSLRYSDTSKGTDFSYMAIGSSLLYEMPEIDTSSGINFSCMFQHCTNLNKIPLLDTSKGTSFSAMFYNSGIWGIPALDTSSGTNFSSMFYGCRQIYSIPALNTKKGKVFTKMFSGATYIHTIPKLNLSSMETSSQMADMFYGCTSLKNITFEGSVKITGDVSVFPNSPNLSEESLMSFINALSDNSSLSTTYTVTIGSENLAKLTDEQKAVATAKNITLA